MISAVPKLAGFAGALALLVGGGALAGGLTNPTPPSGAATASSNHKEPNAMNAMAETKNAGHGSMGMSVRGLGVAENGLRLVVDRAVFTRGRTQQLSFHVVDNHGKRVRDFDVEHTKRMHLIVVRRDLMAFQHVHPIQDAQGNWTLPLRLDEPGSYRMFADFSHDGKPTTLASDLTVDGAFAAKVLPRPQLTADAGGGYSVELDRGHGEAGRESALRFTVLRDGRPVDVQPYLGADGHLVALREGDLAFLHVHPTESGKGITFDATFPTTGRYGLFLQFKVDGQVHTAAFTQVVS